MRRSARARPAAWLAAGLLLTLGAGAAVQLLKAADHRDSTVLTANPTQDIADVYSFQSPSDPSRFVLAMTVAGFIPPTDVATAQLSRNVLYQWNFVRDLKRRMRRKARAWPGRYDLTRLAAIRTVRQFDDAYTAPHFGFRGASDYYHRASAMRVIDRVTVPALIITAEDDPFVPPEPFRDPRVTGNPSIRLLLSRCGGHCGFVAARNGGGDDGYWAETTILDFFDQAWESASLSRSIKSRANSGPFPSSSCLK